MHVTLKSGGKSFGTADWDVLPVEGEVIPLRSRDGIITDVRRVDKIEDSPSGGKIIHLGGARPTFLYAR